jgi:adenylate cyclase
MQKELMPPAFPFRDTGLAIRMGMTVGELIREEQGLFGMSVVMAAWADAMAGAGQILTSQIVYHLLSSAGQFKFDSVGEHILKGVAEAQKLYEINWRRE